MSKVKVTGNKNVGLNCLSRISPLQMDRFTSRVIIDSFYTHRQVYISPAEMLYVIDIYFVFCL